MVAQTGPKIRTGPDKLRGPDFPGPVRGPDFSVRIFLVRSVVRIFWSGFSLVRKKFYFEFILKKKVSGPRTGLRKNPDRYGLSGPKNPDHGPDQ